MVLAWIHRNIFALCVCPQVGSLWQSPGAASRRCTVEQEERPLAGQARTAIYTSLLSATAWARVSSCGASGSSLRPAVGVRAGACESDRGVVPAGAVQRCRHRILLVRRCARAAAGRRVVARPPSTGGGWRRARGARQHPRPRRRGGAPSRLGSWCSPAPTRDPTPAAAPERSSAASGCRAVTVCTGAPQPWACELGRGTMSAEPGRQAPRAPAESRPRRR
jgi:hypothetical protein